VISFSGSLSHLLKYETLRQRHNVPTMLAIDGLQKLYGTTFTPFVVLRSLGLQLTHVLNPVKVSIFIQYKTEDIVNSLECILPMVIEGLICIHHPALLLYLSPLFSCSIYVSSLTWSLHLVLCDFSCL
jgi:hypothetical protein